MSLQVSTLTGSPVLQITNICTEFNIHAIQAQLITSGN